MSLWIMLSALILFILASVPIAFSLGASSLAYLLLGPSVFLSMIPQRIWSGTFSFIILAMPLFILAGELMNRGGLTRRLVDFSLLLVRPIRGGLAEVNVVASMIFAGISGSSVADAAAVGGVLVPAMMRQGYARSFTAGLTAATSTMGMIIPPSVPMLIYAMISGESIAKLFVAGVIPGVLIALSQLIVVRVLSRKYHYRPPLRKYEPRDLLDIAKYGIPAAITPVLLVFSIAFGIATATESAAIAVFYALLLGFFLYQELKPAHVVQSLKKTAMISSSIMIFIGFSMLYSWILAVEQVPAKMVAFVSTLEVHRFWIFLFVDLLILFLGTFLDVTPIIVLLSPVLIPVLTPLGISALQFGVILIVGTAIGLVTPPVGMCLNVVAKLSGLSITEIFWYGLPWIICDVIVLVLVTFVPAISTWLPSLIQ